MGRSAADRDVRPAEPSVFRHGSGAVPQLASLRVSSPDDPAEREAVAAARAVVASPAAPPLQLSREGGAGVIARQASGGGADSAARIHAGGSGGAALPATVQRDMGPRFGADFGDVRIHTDSQAATLSRQLDARAFTIGNHVHFGAGQFAPETGSGRELIAHELAHTVQQGATPAGGVIQRAPADSGSGRLYRTRDGREVELPEDMTAADAARLEAEALVAQKRLGRGPPPKPVPDAKAMARKPAPKPSPRAAPRRAAATRGRAPAEARGEAAAVAALQVVGTSKVAQYLVAKATPVLLRGAARLRGLRRNEQTHDSAGDKLVQTQQAVIAPPGEGLSRSNAGQVEAVGARTPPAVDARSGKRRLQESLAQSVPRTIEDVDNFKRDRKAQHMGAEVNAVVLGDKNAVVGNFEDLQQTPPAAPPDQVAQELPPPEAAPATASLDLGAGAIAPPQKEHTDLTGFTREADNRLKEEGITQEQLDMVDSGDLAAANAEKKGMQAAAAAAPLVAQKAVQQEAGRVDAELRRDESREREALRARRRTALGATGQRQRGAKSALEKKRQDVADHVNGVYQRTQDGVRKKLAALEQESMRRFDDGNTRATKAFEDGVQREFAAYKEERYSGWFGWARRAKDWLLGMDELPRVKEIFDSYRARFVAAIDRLVDDIAADNQRVIRECKDALEAARREIAEYVSKLEPGLADIGKKAAADMNARLAALDQAVADKEQELRDKLKDRQQAAIKAIDEKIEKMKEAMSGALAKLGKLLLLAAKKFFTWALQKFGYSLGEIEGIINKGAAVLKAIFTQPIQFVKNLMKAAVTGFENFGRNFLTHLKNALFEWLTGSLEGLVLPKTWDLPGIVSVALQMIGISYQNIRRHMVAVMGEPVVAGLEKTFTLVKTLVTEGPMAAWEQLKDMAAEMRDAFVEAVKDFIKWKIVEEAIKWVVSLFIPGAGIIKAIIGIYDTVVFFIQKAKQIAQMIGSFLGSIAEIAAGNIGAAADAMERGLARGLSLVISFLAQLLHLSGVTAKIKAAIGKVRAKVDAVLAKVAKWIADKAKAVFGAVKAGVKKVVDWWKKRRVIAGDGERITLYTEGSEASIKVLVASSPGVAWTTYLKKNKPPDTAGKAQKDAHGKAIELARNIEANKPRNVDATVHAQNVEKWFNALADQIEILNTNRARPASVIQYGGTDSEGGANKAEAPILSSHHPQGDKPGDNAPIWDRLKHLGAGLDEPVRQRSYVQGHLLNHNLGGPGLRFNLTPITKRANNKHKTDVEATLKDEVNKRNGKVIYYKVVALKPPPKGANPRLTELKHREAKLRQQGKALRKAEVDEMASLQALKLLTAGFKCEAYELEQDADGKWTKKGKVLGKYTVTIDNDIEDGDKTYGY